MDTLAVNEANLIQNFIDSANVIIYLKDDHGRFLMVNRRVAEMLKVSKEEVIGKTDYDFFPKEEADRFRANDRKVAEAGTPMTFKNTVSFPDGQHTVIDHKFPVSNGKVIDSMEVPDWDNRLKACHQIFALAGLCRGESKASVGTLNVQVVNYGTPSASQQNNTDSSVWQYFLKPFCCSEEGSPLHTQ